MENFFAFAKKKIDERFAALMGFFLFTQKLEIS